MQFVSRGCSVAGCERPYLCKGLCRLHWERQHRTGTTDDPRPRDYTRSASWKGNGAGYAAVHQRMSKRPRPSTCENCGTDSPSRFEWALRPDTPPEKLLWSEGRAYSTDPADYTNLCAACHRLQDFGRDRCGQDHPLSGDNLYVQPSNGKRYCRTCQQARRRARYIRERSRT